MARLARSDVAASDDSVEGWGRTRELVGERVAQRAAGRSMQSASQAMDKRDRNDPDTVAPGTSAKTGVKERDKGKKERSPNRRTVTRPSTCSGPGTWA